MKNIIFIGMPGAGKSTLGDILAKTLGMKFIDTDIVIQEKTGRFLQEIIDIDGPDAFLKIEENIILTLDDHNAVIATGGSVVFSEQAMEYLKSDGVVLYLNISFDKMVNRLKNITTRGIVLIGNQNLQEMYYQRIPIYEKYADIQINIDEDDLENIVKKIVDRLLSSHFSYYF